MTRDELEPASLKILDSMAWLESRRVPMPWSRVIVAYLSGYRPRAGFFKRHIGVLKRFGFVSFPAPFHLALEHEGRRVAQAPSKELTLSVLHDRILETLTRQTRLVMILLMSHYPNRVERELLGRVTLMDPAELANAIASLRCTGLAILPDRQTIVADPIIYPKELL